MLELSRRNRTGAGAEKRPLRIASTYSTVSILVIAGVIPVALLPRE